MIGQTLGHYRILERIGAGGMGEVYRARDERLERDVAIKILSTESIGDLEAGKRLRREAQSASALNDPHICTIYEVGEASGRAFIVMELVEGRALNSLIPPEGLQFWALWQVLSELYRTMALVAVLSGMRSGEIFGLRWRYVDFEERSILVAETVYRGRSSMPKTRASNRKVFMQDLALEVLKRLKSSGGGPDDFVFCTSKGTPFNPNNVRGRVLIPAWRPGGHPAHWLARYAANLRYLVESYRGEPEGAADATRTHQSSARAGCLYPADAGSATAAGGESCKSFAPSLLPNSAPREIVRRA